MTGDDATAIIMELKTISKALQEIRDELKRIRHGADSGSAGSTRGVGGAGA